MLKRERKAKRTRMMERRRKREKRKRREPNNYNFRDQKLIFFTQMCNNSFFSV